ncbi:hypothetical protein EIP91_009273 [Steccherinum ochraceum]|uniref:ABM domain-containing protein n=1 Tax=Steccherinum ochraceum TaxID=92696 RepID=A0A4R0R9Z0_9APHY|nr:hypothetical protein EIP91_009273 [Steccherinum ochraceum]
MASSDKPNREYTSCIEIVSITVNEAYHEDPDIVKDSLGILASVDTLLKAWSGLDLTDGKHFCIVHEWASLEDHQKFMADEALYASLLATVQKYMAGITMMHIQFHKDPRPTFSAPLTEIVACIPRAGVSRSVVSQLVGSLVDVLNESGSDLRSSKREAAFGDCLEDDRTVVAIGWEDFKTSEHVMKTDEVQAMLKRLKHVANLETRSLSLTSFK